MNGTENWIGTIKKKTRLQMDIRGRKIELELMVSGLGKQRIILGYPWLKKYNPEINWNTNQVNWRKTERMEFIGTLIRNRRKTHPPASMEEDPRRCRRSI